MKDNQLEVGDEVIVQTNRYEVARIRTVFRVTKTLAYVGDYTVRRGIEDRGYIREYGRTSSWNSASFRFGTPELLAEARAIGELADAREVVRNLLREAGSRLAESKLPNLLVVADALRSFTADAKEVAA